MNIFEELKARGFVYQMTDEGLFVRGHARARIRAQHREDWFRERCDWILENSGTEVQFRKKCLAFLRNHVIMES